jgi:hypothetical protein
MGFGWLFIGYFVATLMSFNIAGAFIRVVGYGIVFFASGRLSQYNRKFTYLRLATVLMLCISLVISVARISGMLYDAGLIANNIFGSTFEKIVSVIEACASFVFNGIMLYAIRGIATETEVDKISVNAVRNFAFVCIYFVLNIITYLPFGFVAEYTKAFYLPVLLLYFVCVILNLVLIYSCYARICDENDVEMNRKQSRFAFVNKMREELDKKEEKAMAEDREYHSERRKKGRGRRK